MFRERRKSKGNEETEKNEKETLAIETGKGRSHIGRPSAAGTAVSNVAQWDPLGFAGRKAQNQRQTSAGQPEDNLCQGYIVIFLCHDADKLYAREGA
jgi:hypothetical protein